MKTCGVAPPPSQTLPRCSHLLSSLATVLSGAEERFAEERPGWNFSKNRERPRAGKLSSELHANSVCCEDDFFSGIAEFETTPRRRVETFQPLPRPPMRCVRVQRRYRVPYTRYKLSNVTRRWIEK